MKTGFQNVASSFCLVKIDKTFMLKEIAISFSLLAMTGLKFLCQKDENLKRILKI